MKTATHVGTCQACGNQQKLPSGVLSNHGYTKQWGFFNGTCSGAKRLPFEQSCEYVKECIEGARLQIEDLRKKVESVRQSVSTAVKVQVYLGRSYGYVWIDGTVNFENKCVDYVHREKSGNIAFYDFSAWGTDEEVIKKINERFAKNLEKRISEFERYIEWQQTRIANWVPKELKSV